MYTNLNRIICGASDICFLYTKPLQLVITTAQLHSTRPELRFCAGSNPGRGVSEIRDGKYF